VLALYTAITLYLLSPVLPVFNRAIAGDWRATIDGWQNVWGIWWVGHALATGQNPFFTPLLFHPDGASLYFQTLNMTNGLLTLPVQWLWGPLAAYNAAILLGFVLTGYGAYLLTRSLVGHRGAAVLAGAIYTFCPFHLLKFWEGQLEWVTLQWIPFFLLFLLRAFDSGRLRWRLLAALFLVLVSLTSWYGSLFSLIATGLIVLLRLPAAWQRGHWQRDLVTLLVVVGGGGLLLLPVLLPALHEAQGCYRWGVDRTPRAADALDILLPSDLHPLWGETVRRWNGHIRNTKGGGTGTLPTATVCLCWLLWEVWLTGDRYGGGLSSFCSSQRCCPVRYSRLPASIPACRCPMPSSTFFPFWERSAARTILLLSRFFL